MQRRTFLRHLLATSLATGTFGLPMGLVQATSGRTLIVIFQRGGCDGLNTVVPYAESEYYTLRMANGYNIAIPTPDPNNPESAIDLNGFFGLHPNLTLLYDTYKNDDLAIFPAVHFSSASRSHFTNQDRIESGAATKLPNGWLNRYLMSQSSETGLRGLSFSSQMVHSMRGLADVTVINDLTKMSLKAGNFDNDLRAYLRQVYAATTDPNDFNRSLVYQQGHLLLDNLDLLQSIDPSTYIPANNAVYPNTLYGTQLRQAAQLIKENIGLEVVTVDLGSWDHHYAQGGAESEGRQSRLHAQFAQGIHAIYTDLGDLMNQVVILTMTEFGRTPQVNANGGTDHGHASAWFVVGKSIKKGIYGEWPGLAPNQLYQGRYLDHSIDYRDILGEILVKHLGLSDLTTVLPDHSHYQPVGFFET